MASESAARFGRPRRWVVAFFVAMLGGIALVYSASQPPTYEARAEVMVSPVFESMEVEAVVEELGTSREFVATYAEIIEGRRLAEMVVEMQRLRLAPTELAERLDARVVSGTRIIEIGLRDPDPEEARRLVNAVATAFAEQTLPGKEGVEVVVVELALTPDSPASPEPVRDGLLGAGAGLILGILVSARWRKPQVEEPPELAAPITQPIAEAPLNEADAYPSPGPEAPAGALSAEETAPLGEVVEADPPTGEPGITSEDPSDEQKFDDFWSEERRRRPREEE